MATEKNKRIIEIDADCSSVIGYSMIPGYGLPINRLFVKNLTNEDIEEITVCIVSKPQFLVSTIINQDLLPRKSKVSFDVGCIVSPVFMTALNEETTGEHPP